MENKIGHTMENVIKDVNHLFGQYFFFITGEYEQLHNIAQLPGCGWLPAEKIYNSWITDLIKFSRLYALQNGYAEWSDDERKSYEDKIRQFFSFIGDKDYQNILTDQEETPDA